MAYIKKLGKSFLYILVPMLVLVFFFTLLNYFGLISYKVVNIIKFIILILSIFLGSFVLGRNSNTKGWLEGLKLGLILTIIFILFNYLAFGIIFSIKHFIYFIIIIGTSILGSILGINKKVATKS